VSNSSCAPKWVICVTYLHSDRDITQLVRRKPQIIASSATLSKMIPNSNLAGKLAIRLLNQKQNVEYSMRPSLEDAGVVSETYHPQTQLYSQFLPYARENWLYHTIHLDRKSYSRIWPMWKKLVAGEVHIVRPPWTPEKSFEFGPTFVNYVLQTRQWNLIFVSLIHAKYSSIRNLRPIFELINMDKEEGIAFSRSIPGEQQLISFLQPFFTPKQWNSSEWNDNAPVLYAAAGHGYVDSVQFLLDPGVDVNLKGETYGTALHAACRFGHESIVKLLFENGADVHLQDMIHGTALNTACRNGHESIVKFLLGNGAEINLQGGCHGTALNAACAHGRENIVKLLLESGAEINLQGGIFGTAFNTACGNGHESIVKLLLGNGAEINLQGGDYGTALNAACERGHESIVKLLLGNGADINLQGGDYGTALNTACVNGHESIVKLLLKNGVDVNLQGGKYGSALASAREGVNRSSRGKIVKLLLEHGAIEKRDR